MARSQVQDGPGYDPEWDGSVQMASYSVLLRSLQQFALTHFHRYANYRCQLSLLLNKVSLTLLFLLFLILLFLGHWQKLFMLKEN